MVAPPPGRVPKTIRYRGADYGLLESSSGYRIIRLVDGQPPQLCHEGGDDHPYSGLRIGVDGAGGHDPIAFRTAKRCAGLPDVYPEEPEVAP